MGTEYKKSGLKAGFFIVNVFCLLHFVNDGFESLRVVDSEVGEHLAVDLDTGLGESTHQL